MTELFDRPKSCGPNTPNNVNTKISDEIYALNPEENGSSYDLEILLAAIKERTDTQPTPLSEEQIAVCAIRGLVLGESSQYAATKVKPTYDVRTTGTSTSNTAVRERLCIDAAYEASSVPRTVGPFPGLTSAEVAIYLAAEHAYAQSVAEPETQTEAA